MIHLLLDTAEGYPFIAEKSGLPLTRHVSPQRGSKLRTWLAGCREVIGKSKSGDMLVCVLDIQAVICYLLCCLSFRKRKIFGINILLKYKPTMRNKITASLYRLALSSGNFRASVTSAEYGEWLNKMHGMNFRYDYLPDVYYDSYGAQRKVPRGDYVFCGGRNGRDWNFMLEVARNMPDVRFKFVVPGAVRNALAVNAGDNVEIISDVPTDEFLEIMDGAGVVCCPLDTQAPAGLIVMFQAAGHDKVTVSTDTVVTRAYVNGEHGFLLPNEAVAWCKAIREVLEMPDDAYYAVAGNLKSFLSNECGETQYVSRLDKLISAWK